MKGLRSWKGRVVREITKGPPEGPAPHRSKKDTKRWCRGVVGREHIWIYDEWRRMREFAQKHSIVYSVEVCRVCRKEGRHVWPTLWVDEDGRRLHGPAF